MDNLPRGMDNDWLRQIFKHYGLIVDAFVFKKNRINKDAAFGFVRFAKEGEAIEATKVNNGLVVRGRRIIVSWAKY